MKQEHAGAVAVMKLFASSAAAVLGAVSLPFVLEALHTRASREPNALSGLSSRSSSLLLVAAADTVVHFCKAGPIATDQQADLVRRLFGPQVMLLEHALSFSNDTAFADAARATQNIAIMLPRLPQALQACAAGKLAPLHPSLGELLRCPDDEAAEGACAAMVSFCAGCGAHAAPVVPGYAAAGWNCFPSRPLLSFRIANAIGRCAALPSVCDASFRTDGQAAANAACTAFIVHLSQATSSPQITTFDEYVLHQSLQAQLFDLISGWATA